MLSKLNLAIRLAGLVLVVAAFAMPASACRCLVYQSVSQAREDIDRADLVFTGTALSTEATSRKNGDGEPLGVTRFEVINIHKGEPGKTLDIYHLYDEDFARCGPYFEAGETFFVMAREEAGSFIVDPCADTPISELSPHMIDALEPPGPALCDTSELRIEPEYRYHEEDFTHAYAQETLDALSGPIIEWVYERDQAGREVDLTSGELGMAYLNNLNHLQGYILRQKALAEWAEGERGADTEAFCDFLGETPIID